MGREDNRPLIVALLSDVGIRSDVVSIDGINRGA
jgi:hypothetical protein